MSVSNVSSERAERLSLPLPLLVGGALYVVMLAYGPKLLGDPDSYSHLALGRWIIAHGAVPMVDPLSQTMAGQPWVAFEWLSEVIYTLAYNLAGWAGIAVLAAIVVAATFALLTRVLEAQVGRVPTLILMMAVFALAAPHVVARPHALALLPMVAWTASLLRAREEGVAPSWWLLPVMTLWTNLHGSYTIGLALILPIAFEAVWYAPATARRLTALRWTAFAAAAAAASLINPYGPEMLLVTWRTINLGDALNIVTEWQPQDFSHFGAFEAVLFAGIGYALFTGFRLPWPRLLIILGLLHLGLSQSRHGDILGLLAPLFLAQPLAAHLAASQGNDAVESPRLNPLGAAVTGLVLLIATAVAVAVRPLAPPADITPAAAVAATDLAHAGPVLNSYDFGGYLDYAGIPPFIDGRAELYGMPYLLRHFAALSLANLPQFLALLDQYKIQATLLSPTTPAIGLLDRLPDWKRIYSDDVAVVHVRQPKPAATQ